MRGDLLDKSLFDFDVEQSPEILPVWTSAQFNIWEIDIGKPFAIANLKNYRETYFKKITSAARSPKSVFYAMNFNLDNLPFDVPRIAVGWKTNSTNRRTTIAALIPSGIVTTDAASLFIRRKGDEKSEAFLLAFLSSIPFDWLMRKWVDQNLTFEILESAPIPKFDPSCTDAKRLINLSGTLAASDKRFGKWAKKVGVEPGTIKTAESKLEAIAELNALCCKLYGLSREEVIYIYSNFHKNWEFTDDLGSTLSYYDSESGLK
jgi:hypothetical protein